MTVKGVIQNMFVTHYAENAAAGTVTLMSACG
jgi:hypothetical protein